LLVSCQSKPLQKTDKDIHLYLQAEPFCLDPRRGGDRRSQLLLRDLFEGLTRLDKQGKPQMATAKSVHISSDKKTYTFFLKKTNWTNGSPVTAHDFVFAWKTAVDPEFATAFAYTFFVIKNAKKAFMHECAPEEIGLRALNDSTLEITLEHPVPYFLELVANPLFSPVCQKEVQLHPDWAIGVFPSYVCNGPFFLKEHVIKSKIVLEQNPYYTNDPSASTKIIYSHIDEPLTAYNLYQRGELDWFGEPCGFIPIELVKELSRQNRLHCVPTGGLYWIVCCVDKPHLASAKIRHALSYAIDRDEICRLLLQGGEQPAHSILPQFLSSVDKVASYSSQKERAQSLFAEGLKEVGYTKQTFPILHLTHWSERQSTLIAEVIQQQIQTTLGIQVKLDACDWATYMGKVPRGNIDIATAPWYSWVHDPAFNLNYLRNKDNGINGTKWENPTYIHFLEQADIAQTQEQRQLYLKNAEELAMNQMPLIPLYYMTMKFTHSPQISGEVVSPLGFIEMKWVGWKHEQKEGQ
jgi:oligopeptide transport system substrate-binding protein